MELQDILTSIQRGDTPTKEQIDFILSSLSKVVSGKQPDKSMSLEEYEAGLMGALDAVRSTPEGQAQIRDAIAGRKEQRFIKRYTPFFNAILAGADIATSLSQVRDSKDAIRELRRPGMPAVPGIDPALDNAIRQAEIGTMDASRAVAPAVQQLQDQYAQDIALAKSVGGGQASTLGALGQVASLRRQRGTANLAPMIDSIRAREQGRLDNLIGQRMQQTNQNYYNRFRQSQLNLDQYNQDALAAGQLGSVGRLNRRNAVQNLLGAAPSVLARVGNRGYADKYSAYEQSLNQSLTNPNSYGSSHFVQPEYNQFFDPYQNNSQYS